MTNFYHFLPRFAKGIFAAILLVFTSGASAQFSGAVNVGNGQAYTTITGPGGLFEALNAGTITGDVVVNITSNLVEDGSNALNALNETGFGNYRIRLQSSGARRFIFQSFDIDVDYMFNINGADRITFDGGTDTLLVFRNDSEYSAASIFHFDNGAVADTIKGCIIESAIATVYNGAIAAFDNGENRITVMDCYIRNAPGTYYYTGIFSTSASNRITVINNHIYNWDDFGVNIPYSGDSALVTGNHFYNYQDPSPDEQTGVFISGGSGHVVTGNYIGGTAPLAGGSAWVHAGTGQFNGIYVYSEATGAAASIQGNVIQNISMTNAVTAGFVGINIPDGRANIGTAAGNTIGSFTAANGILLAGGAYNSGINTNHAIVNIENNIIANINDTAQYASTYFGIAVAGATTINIRKNKIFNLGLSAQSTAGATVTGIDIFGGNGSTLPYTIENNMVSLGWNVPSDNLYLGIHDHSFTGNNIYLYNNTVLITGTNTGGLASAAFAQDVPSNDRHLNNIYYNLRTGGTGPHLAMDREQPGTGIFSADYNLFYAVDSAKTFRLGYQNDISFTEWKIQTLQDTNSVNAPVNFISLADLHIDTAQQSSWTINDRGIAINTLGTDIDGGTRSTITGLPVDIGADEFSPAANVAPPFAARSGTPAPGTTTSYFSAGKKVIDIIWGNAGTVPPAQSLQYFSGVKPPNFTAYQTINSYYNIAAPGGSGYSYSIKYYYTNAEKNNIPDANLRIIKQDGTNPWIIAGGTAGTDAAGKYILVSGLTSFSKFSLVNIANPLPVTLGPLTASRTKGINLIEWKTYTEINNGRFEIERSDNGIVFEQIGLVLAKAPGGMSSTPLSYFYEDNGFQSAKQYYRLRQIDFDGRYAFSNIAVVASDMKKSFDIVNLYPNPATDLLYTVVESPENRSNAVIQIMDLSGHVVLEKTISILTGRNLIALPVSNLAAGTYIMSINVAGAEVSKTFVKK